MILSSNQNPYSHINDASGSPSSPVPTRDLFQLRGVTLRDTQLRGSISLVTPVARPSPERLSRANGKAHPTGLAI
ncbi:hypothetical protein PROFUN_00075 [Planoprotostelium fungivorum]|uniref:Uncharacterized protein n=1 Tax=Planoprotostelium fungivorum TaxID=1890364 RepID=A0A2P6P0K2_9EUKA|nr:hypothetical protein PROFUN_00075 [Planoprotostelium fungivorum]